MAAPVFEAEAFTIDYETDAGSVRVVEDDEESFMIEHGMTCHSQLPARSHIEQSVRASTEQAHVIEM